jgi:hypothetical protein
MTRSTQTCHNPDARAFPRRGAPVLAPCKYASWRHERAVDSDGSVNAALFGHTTLDALSHPTLQHANSDRSTRVPPMISASLRLGPNNYVKTQFGNGHRLLLVTGQMFVTDQALQIAHHR